MCQIALSKSLKKVLKKKSVVTAVTVVTVVKNSLEPLRKKIMQPFFYFIIFFGKCNLKHSTTNVMFSGQPFAILAIFFF